MQSILSNICNKHSVAVLGLHYKNIQVYFISHASLMQTDGWILGNI